MVKNKEKVSEVGVVKEESKVLKELEQKIEAALRKNIWCATEIDEYYADTENEGTSRDKEEWLSFEQAVLDVLGLVGGLQKQLEKLKFDKESEKTTRIYYVNKSLELEGRLQKIRHKIEPVDHQVENPSFYQITLSKEDAKKLGLVGEEDTFSHFNPFV